MTSGEPRTAYRPPLSRATHQPTRVSECVLTNGAAQLPFAHGNPSARDNAAFLIGRIAGVEPVQEGDPLFYFGDQWEVPNRKLVRMSDVCMIDIPAFMPAWRNPTIYLAEGEVLERLGIGGFNELEFMPLSPASARERSAYAAELVRAKVRGVLVPEPAEGVDQ